MKGYVKRSGYNPKATFTESLTNGWPELKSYNEYTRGIADNSNIIIIRLENLKHDLNIACKKLNIPNINIECKEYIKNKNINNRRNEYQTYYTPETRKIIETRYADDLKHYNYIYNDL